jgi:dTDP-glucose pyrophosphorylase
VLRLTDPRACLCRSGAPVRKAMEQINNTPPHEFVLVTDDDGRLVGTVTDGDIRRAILRGITLDDPVSKCMHREVIAGRTGQTRENFDLLANRPITFLPVLDDGGRVVEVLCKGKQASDMVTALVMAGGFGQRLGERTKTVPKPLLAVGGRPLLDHVFASLEAAGISRIYVAVHYLADQIARFVDGRNNTARIELILEEQPLGTAGALGRLPQPVTTPVLVVNGDVLTHVDFAALQDFHARHGFDATLCVARHDVEIPFGVVRYTDDGLFRGIDEKPRLTQFIAAGVYYLSPEFVAVVPRKGAMDMPELFNLGKSIGLTVGLFPIHEYWTDVGRPDDLEAADNAHRSGRTG